MRKEAKTLAVNVLVVTFVVSLLFVTYLSSFTLALTSSEGTASNISLWDTAQPDGSEKFTVCTDAYCAQKSKSSTNWDIYFYVNYTDSSSDPINATNGGANVTIRFNNTGSWSDWLNMSFNSSSLLWYYKTNFTYKGSFASQINATSSYDNYTINDSLSISNTPPYLIKNPGGFIGNPKVVLQCSEDTLCTYNFTSNVSEDDVNDEITYDYLVANTTLTNFVLNETTGVLEINFTNNSDITTNDQQLELIVRDSDTASDTAILEVNITTINDAPIIGNLTNVTMNRSELFSNFYNITDEEGDFNLTLNVTFLSCEVAAWSTRNCSGTYPNITLFNESDYTFNGSEGSLNITFTPDRNDVGNYTINFTITDSGQTYQPYNASRSYILNFEVLNLNEDPYFTFVCNPGQLVNATEDTEFSCYINATDIDELTNLTFTANESWFNFSESNTSSVQINNQFNFSTLVRINATDVAVGNWSVNISATDTGSPTGTNSTILSLYIGNVNDSVAIDNIPDQSIFTSGSRTIYVIAQDNDLLIPDESVYDESLTFTSNNSNVLITGTTEIAGTNKINASIFFNGSDFSDGVYAINISVNDSNGHSQDSDVFTITVTGNNAPYWNASTPQNYTLNEDTEFSLNLSEYAIDADSADNLSFTYQNHTTFHGFAMNGTTGVINFTPQDFDVGFHNITFTVSDTKATADLLINFTVYNVNDTVSINTVTVTIVGISATNVVNNGAANLTEDNESTISVRAVDYDFNISQTSYFDELHTINLTIQGPNPSLFSFISTTDDTPLADGVSSFFSTNSFYPNKSDVGEYNVTINITDTSGNSDEWMFNLTILEVEHPPNITSTISNQVLSIENETFFLDINASDLEDGDESTGNLTFIIINQTTNGNFFTINSTNGVINFTTNSTMAGLHEYLLTVNDSDGDTSTVNFNITIYDYPTIILPAVSFEYNLVENSTYELNFSVNHSVQDNLNYTLLINGVEKNTTAGYGNGSDFLWDYTPSFLDETTCTGVVNLTLNVSNARLSNTTSWNITINHTNYPLTFNTSISNQDVGSPLTLTLSDYFIDFDASDSCVNQSVTFTSTTVPNSTSGAAISVSFTHWLNATTPEVTFSAGSEGSANYSITAFEYAAQDINTTPVLNTTSNNFSISLTSTSEETPTVTSGGGGGGGGSSNTGQTLISLKIIVPEPVSAKQKDKLIIPLKLVNEGDVDLEGITLSSIIAKDGLLRTDLVTSFDVSYFDEIKVDESEDVTMIVDIDTTDTGLFEITLNGTVEDPEYSDWAKMYIEIDEEFDILERIIFTEEFVIGNPACAEFKDLINEAKELFGSGKTEEAQIKSESALESCKQAITQPPRPRIYERIGDRFFTYAAIASLAAFGAGFIYYYYRRIRLKSQLGYPQGKL